MHLRKCLPPISEIPTSLQKTNKTKKHLNNIIADDFENISFSLMVFTNPNYVFC